MVSGCGCCRPRRKATTERIQTCKTRVCIGDAGRWPRTLHSRPTSLRSHTTTPFQEPEGIPLAAGENPVTLVCPCLFRRVQLNQPAPSDVKTHFQIPVICNMILDRVDDVEVHVSTQLRR